MQMDQSHRVVIWFKWMLVVISVERTVLLAFKSSW